MEPNKSSNNLPDNMDVVVVIDKDKLPEDVRKLLETNLPKDVQEKVLKMLGRPPLVSVQNIENKSNDKSNNKPYNETEAISKDNRLFAIQTCTVVGNIYTDGIYKKEEDSYIKKKDI